MEKNSTKATDGGVRFADGVIRISGIAFKIVWLGMRNTRFLSPSVLIVGFSGLLILFSLTYGDYVYLKILHSAFPATFTPYVVLVLRHLPKWFHFLVMSLFSLLGIFFLKGIFPYGKRQRFQRDLDAVGLSNAQKLSAKVIEVIEPDENRTKLLIAAKGVGIDKFETKRGDLESSFHQKIEQITASHDRKNIVILLCKKELTKNLPFREALDSLKEPYSFVVGGSANGILTQDIRELPHLLIAGSTGGGKSVFFRQVLVGLLYSSAHIQMYLIDLKRGVEVKEFGRLPNVKIAKDETEAVKVLQAIKEEMHRRFAFMEELGIKKIDPAVHKKDLIVVGIDEASVLYGKTSLNKAKSEFVAEARELTDELAKLARAAGIHIIVSTQKAIKDSIDTKTLENLTGRMAFKMTTHAGSNLALGNGDAYSLPDIKGRGIWAGGNKFIEVQAPYLSEKELDQECKNLMEKFRNGENFQPMLKSEAVKNGKTDTMNSQAA